MEGAFLALILGIFFPTLMEQEQNCMARDQESPK